MREIRYETPIEEVKTLKNSIFLAGPTVRGHQIHLQPSWRFEACEILKELGFDGNVIIPEFTDITKPDKDNEEWIVPWEYEGLKVADSIIFWIPRTKELIGLNTNFEFGYWMARYKDKVIYGRPDGSYRNKYLDIMWKINDGYTKASMEERRIFNTLKDTCKDAVECINFIREIFTTPL